jgi:hypothetical protein
MIQPEAAGLTRLVQSVRPVAAGWTHLYRSRCHGLPWAAEDEPDDVRYGEGSKLLTGPPKGNLAFTTTDIATECCLSGEIVSFIS